MKQNFVKQIYDNFSYFYKNNKKMGLISFDSVRRYLGSLLIGKNNFNFRNEVSNTFLGKEEIYIDTCKPREIYDESSQIRTVIKRDSSMFSNMVLKIRDKKTKKEVDNHPLLELFNNPNLLQSFNQWVYNYNEQLNLYGNQFIYKRKASSIPDYPDALINFSPEYIKPELSGKWYEQRKMNKIIDGYKYEENTIRDTFKPEQIIWSKINDIDSPLVGISMLHGLKYPVSNSIAAYKYFNAISTSKGAIGILSTSKGDSQGILPLDSKEQKRIEDAYTNQYGLDEHQSKVIVTRATTVWNPLSYPTKDLLLQEQIDNNFVSICDHFGHNINIYGKNSTYENVQQGIVMTYQDRIQPNADSFAQLLSKHLFTDVESKKLEIIASYEHVPILQKAKKDQMKSIDTVVNALTKAIEGGILDVATAKKILSTELGLIGQ